MAFDSSHLKLLTFAIVTKSGFKHRACCCQLWGGMNTAVISMMRLSTSTAKLPPL